MGKSCCPNGPIQSHKICFSLLHPYFTTKHWAFYLTGVHLEPPPWNHLPFAPNLLCDFPLFIFWRLAAAFVLVKACVVGDPRRKSVLWFELKMKWSHHLSWQQWIWVSLVANSSCTYRCIQLTPVSAHMGRHNSTLRSLPTHFISWGRYLWKRNTRTAHDCAVIPAQ